MTTLLRDYQILHQEFTTLVNEYLVIDQSTQYAKDVMILALEKYLLITGTDVGSLQYMVTNYFGNSSSNYYTTELTYINQMKAFLKPYYYGALTVPLSPNRIAIDSSGNIYFTDLNVSVIKILTPDGRIGNIAGTGVSGYSGDGDLAILAQVNFPQGITVDNSGNIYFADTYNNRIRKITNGIITTIAGTGGSGYTGDGDSALYAELNAPQGIAVDNLGYIYIADTTNNCIRKITGGIITTICGSVDSGYAGDNGPAINAQLNTPIDVAVDGNGSIFIADTGNSRIRAIPYDDTVGFYGYTSTFGLFIYTIGGPSGADNDRYPTALTYKLGQGVYVSDRDNNDIIKIASSNGAITTVADSGNGISAPNGISMDKYNNIYVSTNNVIQCVAGSTGTFYGVSMTSGNTYLIAGNSSPD